MGSTLRLARGAALGAAILLFAGAARADEALDLSKKGYELLLANKCDEAIPILERSAQLAPEARTLVNLGRCEEKTKHLKAALQHFAAARELARAKLTAELVAQLDAMVAETEQRIPHVKIFVAEGAPASTVVKQGGVELARDTRELGVAVDPGDAMFVVSAAGHESRTFTVTLAEGHTQSLTVGPGARLEPPPPPRPFIEPPSSEPNRSPLETIGVITMIGGAAAIAAGGAFGAVAMGKKSDAEDAGCKDRRCPDGNAANLRDDARAAGTVSTIFFIGGGVLAAAGLGVFLLAPSAGHDRVGLTMSGRF
ncbi:MAG: tetratricopeptide repeat protein [Labilithrix sp.]